VEEKCKLELTETNQSIASVVTAIGCWVVRGDQQGSKFVLPITNSVMICFLRLVPTVKDRAF